MEDAFSKQKEEEERNRKAEVQRKEQERLDAIKRKEQKRILEVSIFIAKGISSVKCIKF